MGQGMRLADLVDQWDVMTQQSEAAWDVIFQQETQPGHTVFDRDARQEQVRRDEPLNALTWQIANELGDTIFPHRGRFLIRINNWGQVDLVWKDPYQESHDG